jgi:drug/metabolite transporter (DMT)-like permease
MRFTIAALILGFLLFPRLRRMSLRDGINGLAAGFFLFAGFYFQTVGLVYTTPSNNAFITSTNVIMVPFIAMIAFRTRPRFKFFILAFTCFAGVSLLNYSPAEGLRFNSGDLYTLLCAFFFACHIAFLGKASRETDTAALTFLQMAVASVFSLAVFLLADGGSVQGIDFKAGLPAVIYLGLFSTLLCFFIQTTAQRYTSSAKAAIFLSTEALFGTLFSVSLGLEPFSMRMLTGGSLILFSLILSELDLKITGRRPPAEAA